MHIPIDERSKLDVKTHQCVFMGYSQNEFGYRLYSLVEKKLIRSGDIVFMEDQTMADIDKMEKAESDNSDKLIDLEIICPTPMVDQLDVETQNDQHGASDDSKPRLEILMMFLTSHKNH